MKAKVIIWTWTIGWFLLVAGIGTIEQAKFGSVMELVGWLLTLPWFVSCLLIIKNEQECVKEVDNIESWFDNLLQKINKFFSKADS